MEPEESLAMYRRHYARHLAQIGQLTRENENLRTAYEQTLRELGELRAQYTTLEGLYMTAVRQQP